MHYSKVVTSYLVRMTKCYGIKTRIAGFWKIRNFNIIQRVIKEK